jgi:hypothetical protein
MGKRTSDFMAIAAIFGGAGLGLGLSGLCVAIRASWIESRGRPSCSPATI